jgi:hypothetical protein
VSDGLRCSDLSAAAGEPIGATATFARNWLVLEMPGTWPRDVSDGAGLPEAARTTVRDWLARSPDSRLVYVRRPGRARGARRLAFVVRADEDETEVRRLELVSSDELAAVDLDSAGRPSDAPLVLVCGHGTRDRCCALRGTAVYAALAPGIGPEELWISSHQGGHRFAPNVLVLPQGVQLGRVSAVEASVAVASALAGVVPLVWYRGRTAYPPDVQAAERAVRESVGLEALDELRLAGVDGERVSFRAADGREHAAVVEHGVGPAVPASCGAAPEPHRVLTARVMDASGMRDP